MPEQTYPWGLTEAIAQLLNAALAQGAGYTLLVCAVAINGAMQYYRYDSGTRITQLAEHSEGEVFAMPVSLMVIDAAGNASRGFITRDSLHIAAPENLH